MTTPDNIVAHGEFGQGITPLFFKGFMPPLPLLGLAPPLGVSPVSLGLLGPGQLLPDGQAQGKIIVNFRTGRIEIQAEVSLDKGEDIAGLAADKALVEVVADKHISVRAIVKRAGHTIKNRVKTVEGKQIQQRDTGLYFICIIIHFRRLHPF